MKTINWLKYLLPLFKKYRGKKHPLDYRNRFELVTAVILSAQDSDKHINSVAPAFFKKFPSIKHLAKVAPQELFDYIGSVRNFGNKAKWLTGLANAVKNDAGIPHTLEELTALPGIGRKSANVIIRESGDTAEGVIVDLHVMRVVQRLGIEASDNAQKIEKKLMEIIPPKYWNDAGMAFSFLGREICRPTNPHCEECVMNPICVYYNSVIKKKKKK